MADSTKTQRRMRFERLVREAERQLAESPLKYKASILALALLGYLVLFGVLGALIALIVGSVWGAFASTVFLLLLLKKKLIIPLVAMVWVIMRALWVRLEPPRGYVADRRDFAALHAEVSQLRRRLAAPKVHEIIISDDFNAGVVQTPRLGVFGWSRNTVLLGLPLLLALTPDQARAVLAHEFGHLSHNHARFNGWVYRLRLTWYRIMEAFDQSPGWCTRAMKRFFDWYAPYFSAYSFALARGNEYEADAVSVQLTSVQTAAQALVTTHIRADLIHEQYWRPLLERADREPEPESRPYTGLAHFLKDGTLSRADLLERIRKAVAVETEHADTHPALRDRLQAMKAPAVLPGLPARNAAEEWLGTGLAQLIGEFDRNWHARNREPWQQRFHYVQEAKRNLNQLSARPREQLSVEERWNLAAWTEEFHREADALPLYQEYQRHVPHDRDADFAIGRLLLARRDKSGLTHLERAMERLELALPACEIAHDYFTSIGDKNQADFWRRRAERCMDTEDKAHAERQQISVFDTYVSPDLDPMERERLRKQLAAVDNVKHAWIAKKQLKYAAEHPIYVIAIEVAGLFAKGDALTAELSEKIETPGPTYFVALKGDWEKIAQQVKKVGMQLM